MSDPKSGIPIYLVGIFLLIALLAAGAMIFIPRMHVAKEVPELNEQNDVPKATVYDLKCYIRNSEDKLKDGVLAVKPGTHQAYCFDHDWIADCSSGRCTIRIPRGVAIQFDTTEDDEPRPLLRQIACDEPGSPLFLDQNDVLLADKPLTQDTYCFDKFWIVLCQKRRCLVQVGERKVLLGPLLERQMLIVPPRQVTQVVPEE